MSAPCPGAYAPRFMPTPAPQVSAPTRNGKILQNPELRHTESDSTLRLNLSILAFKPYILPCQISILAIKPSILASGPPILGCKVSILDGKVSILRLKPSILGPKTSLRLVER